MTLSFSQKDFEPWGDNSFWILDSLTDEHLFQEQGSIELGDLLTCP